MSSVNSNLSKSDPSLKKSLLVFTAIPFIYVNIQTTVKLWHIWSVTYHSFQLFLLENKWKGYRFISHISIKHCLSVFVPTMASGISVSMFTSLCVPLVSKSMSSPKSISASDLALVSSSAIISTFSACFYFSSFALLKTTADLDFLPLFFGCPVLI